MSNRIGDSRLQFGITDEVWGYSISSKQDASSKKVEAPNGAGNTVAAEFFNIGEEKRSGSYYFLTDQTGGPKAALGTTAGVTLTDMTGITHIDGYGKARASGAWSIIDWTGTYYPFLVNS